jgi:hypothetical protein
MNTNEKLAELRSLQTKADTIREQLGISPPGKVTFLAQRDAADDDMVVVETDGFGRATTSVVEGHYPLDYITKFEKSFPREQEAEAAAEAVAFKGISPRQLLGPPS